MTPCCSSIGPVPETIPAGGSVEVAVQLRPGFQTGLMRVGFLVPTGREDGGAIGLTLAATLISSLEVKFAEDTATTLAAGKMGALKGRITCRRKGSVGLDAPSSVTIDPPAQARFLGPSSGRDLADGIRQTVREFEVEFPPSREPGKKSAELRLGWKQQGREDRRPIVWVVKPALTATPRVLALKADAGDPPAMRGVVVESTGAEFRVLAVKGRAVADGFEPPVGRSRSHRMVVPLNPGVTGISELIIETDHPDQSAAKVSVLIGPRTASAPAPGGSP